MAQPKPTDLGLTCSGIMFLAEKRKIHNEEKKRDSFMIDLQQMGATITVFIEPAVYDQIAPGLYYNVQAKIDVHWSGRGIQMVNPEFKRLDG